MKPFLLIADADVELLEFHRRFFVDHGFRVETATDGLTCLSQMRRHWPDLLVLDRDLPWGGSDGVLARMREDSDIPEAPVVLMSTSEGEDRDGGGLPVVACLLKPFRLKVLVDAVVRAATTIPAGTVDACLSDQTVEPMTARESSL